MMHLDPRTWAALLDGSLPPNEAEALSRHLEEGCDACDRLVAELSEADAAGGSADAALARAFPPRGASGNDLEFARIRAALAAERSASPPRRRVSSISAIAATFLVVAVGAVAWRAMRPPDGAAPAWDGVKGRVPTGIPIRLRFLVMNPDGTLAKGLSGDGVGREAKLLFEIEAAGAVDVALVRVSGDGATEPVWSRRVPAGRTQVTVDGRPAAYPLAPLRGAQRFLLIAAENGLDASRAQRAAAALAPPHAVGPGAPALEGLSIDAFEVTVR